jgi:Ca2+:H+ antiporter
MPSSSSPAAVPASSPFSPLREPLYWLLAAAPLAVILEVMHAPDVWIFGVSCVAIVPLAGLMGRATENLAETFGAGIGGLLNATFENAAELIIALVALRKGRPALSILAGGLRYPRQVFNRTAASMGPTLLGIASVSLLVPSVFFARAGCSWPAGMPRDAGSGAGSCSPASAVTTRTI